MLSHESYQMFSRAGGRRFERCNFRKFWCYGVGESLKLCIHVRITFSLCSAEAAITVSSIAYGIFSSIDGNVFARDNG